MPKPVRKEDTPDTLKPYLFHGLQFDSADGVEYITECPLCGKPKFSLNVEKEQWHCVYCDESGNATTFVRRLHDVSDEATVTYDSMMHHRNISRRDTLMQWGICKSVVDDSWMVPGYNAEGALCNLYRYLKFKDGWKLLPTPGLGTHMFGVNLCDASRSTYYICEGPWDAIVLWETLNTTTDDYTPTSNAQRSLIRDSNVIGVPGCMTFKDSWCRLFLNKIVIIMFDNDHQRPHPKTGKMLPPAGYTAMKKLAGTLSASDTPPEEIYYMAWGGSDREFDPELASGYDVRDFLCKE